MNYFDSIASTLAAAFLDGDRDVEGLVSRGSHLLQRRWRWLRPLARRIVANFPADTRPRQVTLATFILHDAGFLRACDEDEFDVVSWIATPTNMCPIPAARSWKVPPIVSVRELADWLGVTLGELTWFADLRSWESKPLQKGRRGSQLRHYRYRRLLKRFGHIRLIESPKPRLKQIQRRILTDLLDQIPTHDAAHGFRRGRSIKTFATPHVGQQVVLKIDLQDFFPTVPLARIQAIFRMAGYSEAVSDLLAGLCTNSAPDDEWETPVRASVGSSIPARQVQRLHRRYSQPHLPQGAPTSPVLANLSAFRLDCRLAGLAHSVGAHYTRYADDLAFSGDREFERRVHRFQHHVGATVLEERFFVNHHKTRIMRQGSRQQLAGLVVNRHLNVARVEFDRLKATLTNCVRHGAASQNVAGHDDFRRHLDGRVAFVEMVNAKKGLRLRAPFEQIVWAAQRDRTEP